MTKNERIIFDLIWEAHKVGLEEGFIFAISEVNSLTGLRVAKKMALKYRNILPPVAVKRLHRLIDRLEPMKLPPKNYEKAIKTVMDGWYGGFEEAFIESVSFANKARRAAKPPVKRKRKRR